MEQTKITVGENLSLPSERIDVGAPEELKDRELLPLSLIFTENPEAGHVRLTHGLSDAEFLRGDVPMTKQEVRAVSLAKLELTERAVVYDIGAGTGSVSVECARLSETVSVYAVERDPEALALLEKNKRKFCLENLYIVSGEAPAALSGLPAPTHVFVGGSGGHMKEILAAVLEKNREARVVVNLITPESLGAVLEFIREAGIRDEEMVQLSAARSRRAGKSHLMMGQNPVWIVSFTGKGEE